MRRYLGQNCLVNTGSQKILILKISIILETRGILDTGVIENLVDRVRKGLMYYPRSLPEITCAASLAQLGLLGSVREMLLLNVDLTSVPAENLASLASSVTQEVQGVPEKMHLCFGGP